MGANRGRFRWPGMPQSGRSQISVPTYCVWYNEVDLALALRKVQTCMAAWAVKDEAVLAVDKPDARWLLVRRHQGHWHASMPGMLGYMVLQGSIEKCHPDQES